MLTYKASKKYEACSSLTANNFNGNDASTQHVSCKDGTDAEYGTTGSVAKGVTEDPYKTWLYVTTASAVTTFVIDILTLGPLATEYSLKSEIRTTLYSENVASDSKGAVKR